MVRKVISAVFSAALAISLAACGIDPGTGTSGEKTTTVTGEVIKAEIPAGWCIVTSTDMTGASGADFICRSETYELGDSYLQAIPDSRNIDTFKRMLESTDPYGTYFGEVELTNGTWYIAANAAVTPIAEGTLIVKGYEIDFNSDEVQSILGSLQCIE